MANRGIGYSAKVSIDKITVQSMSEARENIINELCEGLKKLSQEEGFFSVNKLDDGTTVVSARFEISI